MFTLKRLIAHDDNPRFAAAFAKFSKEIIRQTEALAGAKKGKPATEAKDK
ncbi:hypothetical protein LCGC14_2485200, partial [marine sediment metagenome]